MKFELGQTVVTSAAMDTLIADDILIGLHRHRNGDWGELDQEDAASNERALIGGDRLLSVYRDSRDTKFWIITEWDRSVTTVLLPSDY